LGLAPSADVAPAAGGGFTFFKTSLRADADEASAICIRWGANPWLAVMQLSNIHFYEMTSYGGDTFIKL